MTRRILFYVHFNRYNQLSDHVIYQLETMRPLFEKVVLISNSQLSQADVAKVPVDDFIQRGNRGYDFAAWQEGMLKVGLTELEAYDSVTLMNDTTFGPLYDMTAYYEGYEQDSETDFWGITNHRATKEVDEHIQSYYTVYHNDVVTSQAFKDFWTNVQNFENVQDVIDHYETALTTNLVKAGFHYKTIMDTRDLSTAGMMHPDFSYWNPTAIVRQKVPFLKVKAVGAFKDMTPLTLNDLRPMTDYPMDLIYSHMTRFVERPDEKYLLANDYLGNAIQTKFDKPVAIHMHAFYVDLLPEFFDVFKTYDFAYDLFITTDVYEKKAEIESVLEQYGMRAEIFVTGNVGRDVLPMLKLKERLQNYEIIGHFHTKKSKEADFIVGESWRKDLIDMLAKPANQIVRQFNKDSLGLVIADVPTFFRYNEIVNADNEAQIAPHMNDLWQRMGMTKDIDFTQMETFVMSYGTYAWFRYDALKPLFDLNLMDADVPKEPLPQNSILHAIERALIYIAWDKFYEFKIAPSAAPLTPFIDVKTMNHRGNRVTADWNALGGKQALKFVAKKALIKLRLMKP